jgi:hypothetical protein
MAIWNSFRVDKSYSRAALVFDAVIINIRELWATFCLIFEQIPVTPQMTARQQRIDHLTTRISELVQEVRLQSLFCDVASLLE